MDANNLDQTKCRCGAYTKFGLRNRKTQQPCCSGCYDSSWAGVSDAEWEKSEMSSSHDDIWEQNHPYEDPYREEW